MADDVTGGGVGMVGGVGRVGVGGLLLNGDVGLASGGVDDSGGVETLVGPGWDRWMSETTAWGWRVGL